MHKVFKGDGLPLRAQVADQALNDLNTAHKPINDAQDEKDRKRKEMYDRTKDQTPSEQHPTEARVSNFDGNQTEQSEKFRLSQNPTNIKFEDCLDPDLLQLCQPNWFKRPKSSGVYGSKTVTNLQVSANALTAGSTNLSSSRQGMLSGKANALNQNSRRSNLKESGHNRDILTKLGSLASSGEGVPAMSNQSARYDQKKSFLFFSPREPESNQQNQSSSYISPSKYAKNVDFIDKEDPSEAKPAKRGTLKDIYSMRRLKYSPTIELATPKVEETKVEQKEEMKEIASRAMKACFSNESTMRQKEQSAHKMSQNYLKQSFKGSPERSPKKG